MVDPQHLRLGNWLIGMSGKPFQVSKINLPAGSKNQLQPIAITEEWLKQFGFSHMPPLNQYAKRGNWRKPLDNAGNEMQFDDRQGYRLFSYNGCILWKSPIYVHQLQNLYFALTGEELQAKM